MDRKKIVKALEKHFGVKSKYLGAPTFNYQLITDTEKFIIDREGRIVTATGKVLSLEAIINPRESNTFDLPMEGHSGRSLRNIINMIHSKQPLIKKALGINGDLVEEGFVVAINDIDIKSIESFKKAIEEIGKTCPGVEFDFENKNIVFQLPEEEGVKEAAIELFALINKNAKLQKRSLFKVKPTTNEKYTFRTWLLRLGMIGDEFKEARKTLLSGLPGNGSFKDKNTK